jgi:hypothetical protein
MCSSTREDGLIVALCSVMATCKLTAVGVPAAGAAP